MSRRYKIVVIEPSVIVTEGLKMLLASSPEFEVADSFTDMVHIADRIQVCRPDIVLINPAIVDFQKRFLVRNLFPGLSDVVLIALVYGYVEPDVLKQYQGSIHIYDDHARILKNLRQAVEQGQVKVDAVENYDLTDREKEILVSVVKGLTNKEIADVHNISIHTVISHRKNISRRTGIKSISGLTVYALLNNLVDHSEIE